VKIVASKFLFYLGDAMSNLLYFKWMSAIFYPVYKKLMLWSASFDKDGKIWKKPKAES
tara:strand:- start:267 stop:440 length:174 start_codon:yes stop_codon:yes gene_type:complete